jgi:DNA repair photolyase
MGRAGLARVGISLTTLDPHLSRKMEPRAAAPQRRLDVIAALAGAGCPVMVLLAPVIPAINDHEIERLLEAAAKAGAQAARYIVLRLPLEVRDLFTEWLDAHFPDRAARVMAQVRALHGGRDYDATFGKRMRGEGVLATLISRRVAVASARHGLAVTMPPLRCDLFRVPQAQLPLF